MRMVRSFLMTALLAGLVWFGFFNSASAREVSQLAWDAFDTRPARSVLFIGNSRTYAHGIPYMVRRMADSAGAPVKYQIRMHALPGESFQRHWHNREVQALLGQHWDEVILQGDSGAHADRASAESFQRFGALLARRAAVNGARPNLFVGWNYTGNFFEGMDPGAGPAYHRAMQDDYARLGGRTGARLANVGAVWKSVLDGRPHFRLESDGNHPSIHGSYLAALVLYARLSGGDVAHVRYVPSGLSDEDAALLRREVRAALRRNA